MTRNKHFEVNIYSLLIAMAPLVIWAPAVASSSTQEDLDLDEQRKYNAELLQNIDMHCRGEVLLPENIQRQLKCRYTDHGNPYLKIAPFKEEEAYLEPRIVIFHDAIYDDEIEILLKLAQKKINVTDVISDEEKILSGRIGHVAWFDKDEHETIKVLYRRVNHMTNFSVTTAEDLQLFYYGIGGMYLPHFDFFRREEWIFSENGERIATLMFYLNDVKEGGRTVFERINVSLTPKKGSAVFWYNLLPNGNGDILSIHAACPVIAGTKWVANVWLHEVGQEFIRPCTLENQPLFD